MQRSHGEHLRVVTQENVETGKLESLGDSYFYSIGNWAVDPPHVRKRANEVFGRAGGSGRIPRAGVDLGFVAALRPSMRRYGVGSTFG